MSRRRTGRRGRKLLFALAVVLVFSLVIDRVLGLFGWPSDYHEVAPPNYRRRVENEEFSYDLVTNDRGIRYRTIPLRKPAGKYRVVLLGDSFTDGTGVDVDRRWSNLIERRFEIGGERRVELVNCGEAGTGPLDYARTLISIGERYQPDLVIVGIYHNDIANTPPDAEIDRHGVRRILHFFWPRIYTLAKTVVRKPRTPRSFEGDFIGSVERLAVQRNVPPSRIEKWKALLPPAIVDAANARRLNYFTLANPLIRSDYYRSSIDLDTEYARRQDEAVKRLLELMHERCRKRKTQFAVVHFPVVYQFDPNSEQRLEARLYAAMRTPMRSSWLKATPLENSLQQWCRKQQVPYLNLAPVFRRAAKADSPLTYRFDVHFTPAGHQLAAEAILAWLVAKKMVPDLPADDNDASR